MPAQSELDNMSRTSFSSSHLPIFGSPSTAQSTSVGNPEKFLYAGSVVQSLAGSVAAIAGALIAKAVMRIFLNILL